MRIYLRHRHLFAILIPLLMLTGTHYMLFATPIEAVDVANKKDLKEDIKNIKTTLSALGEALYLVPKNYPGSQGAKIPISVLEERLNILTKTPSKQKEIPSYDFIKDEEGNVAWNNAEWKHIQEELRKEVMKAASFIKNSLSFDPKQKGKKKAKDKDLETKKKEAGDLVSKEIDALQKLGSKSTMEDLNKSAEILKKAMTDVQESITASQASDKNSKKHKMAKV